MAKKPAPKKPPTGLPAAIDSLITSLLDAGLRSDDGGEALRRKLTALPYAAAYYPPCPRFDSTDPDPLTPNTAFDVHFDVNWTGIEYTVAVLDTTTSTTYGPFNKMILPGSVNPVFINVPAQAVPIGAPAGAPAQPILVAGHDYQIYIYAQWGGVVFGCIWVAYVTLGGDPLTEAVFKALTAQGGLPFGNVPDALLAQNAAKPAARPAKKK